ncbi:MAG: patatin-like phospholipase family protein [Rhodomicrobium sp.]|nr:patatin-like phospholipase family protein [Rhodomicrobium sp.]
MSEKPKVAIACQGGGSHAAFAAGVLGKLLSPPFRDRFDLVALSGTSGGAVCAALAWAGLISDGHDDAVRRLSNFWHDLEVHDLLDAAMNFWTVTLARMPVTQELSPYTYEPVAEPALRSLLQRHLGLENLPAGPGRRARPALLIGATEILTGERTVFHGTALTYDMLIASAAIPPLYRAVEIGRKLYWDGLFASNPPIRELTDLPERPAEIWVVQINPQHRPVEPRSVRDIDDRRNELAGNLSLGQELFFIHKINDLLAKHASLAERYQDIQVRVVELGIDGLDYPSKLDRSSVLIEQLLANGAKRAEWFFDKRSAWPREGTIPAASVSHYAHATAASPSGELISTS